MTENLIAAAEAYEQNLGAVLTRYRSGFTGKPAMLLLVCAHFPMTQTLIKIIITAIPCMDMQVFECVCVRGWVGGMGLCRLSPGLYKRDQILLMSKPFDYNCK